VIGVGKGDIRIHTSSTLLHPAIYQLCTLSLTPRHASSRDLRLNPSSRRRASKRRKLRSRKRRRHTRNRRIQPQPSSPQRTQSVDGIKRVPRKLPLEAPHPPRPALVPTLDLSGDGVELLFLGHGVVLAVEADFEHGGEGLRWLR